MERMLAFSSEYPFTFDSGIAVLDPTYHDYEDAWASMYVKVVFYSGYYATRATFCKVRASSKGLYFVKFGRRYYLDDGLQCGVCGIVTPHSYKLIRY